MINQNIAKATFKLKFVAYITNMKQIQYDDTCNVEDEKI